MEIIQLISVIFTYALIVATTTERFVEIIKAQYPDGWKKLNKYQKKLITILIAILWSIPMYHQIGWNFLYVGLVGSLGSNFVHSVLALIEEYKKNAETDRNIKTLAVISQLGGDDNGDMADVQNEEN